MRTYFLQTERLGFSTWQDNDIDLAKSLWGNPAVTKFISVNGIFSSAQIATRLQQEIQQYKESATQYWPLFTLDTQTFIGCCGLRPYDLNKHIYEFGIHLCPEAWGKGYGTEAANAIITYAFTTLKAKELFAGHHPNNIASAKMLKKLGFEYLHDEWYKPTKLYHPSYRYKNKKP